MDWQLFISAFGLIFLAELPDKTALATMYLATQNRALPVFLGAALAFFAQSLIGIAFGNLLALLPPRLVQYSAALLFLVFAVLIWRSRYEIVPKDIRPVKRGFVAVAMTAFLVIFAAEWGDITQLATATMQAKYQKTVTIFAASTLALWFVALIAVLTGKFARRRMDMKLVKTFAALAFACVGLSMLVASF